MIQSRISRAKRPVWWLESLTSVCLLGTLACSAGSAKGHGAADGHGGTNGSSGANSQGGSLALEDPSTTGGVGAPGDCNPSISPETIEIHVEPGKPIPTQVFVGHNGAAPANLGWSVDRGELGSVDAQGNFKPSGLAGGTVHVRGACGQRVAQATVTISVTISQNGLGDDEPLPDPLGGVGGEGVGAAVSSDVQAVLDGPPAQDSAKNPALRLLYPYDGTIWPRGLQPPLLQWAELAAPAQAVKIRLRNQSRTFDYQGYFSATRAAFNRHPIPAAVWEGATQSAGAGDPLTVEVTLASAGRAYALAPETWTIAPGRLTGTVYYGSYNTALTGRPSDGAVLALHATDGHPRVVAGNRKCRGCHTASSDGSTLLAQHGDDDPRPGTSSWYDLKNSMPDQDRVLGLSYAFLVPGLYPDGSAALSNSAFNAQPQLYSLPSEAPLSSQGLQGVIYGTPYPAFSHDGKHVAFGSSELVAYDFDPTTRAFSNGTSLGVASGNDEALGWPAFLPTNDALVYHHQLGQHPTESSKPLENLGTRNGMLAELWWVDLGTGNGTPLRRLNGRDDNGNLYLPKGTLETGHDDDSVLNYEPTVLPVAVGGYAWVLFTSRRMYGNVTQVNAWWSDPNQHDLENNITPKKLWVAAIDLNAPPGTDPSHPAFYLPGQERKAGNHRGFWVLDPCREAGASCETGDQCCGGYCQPGASGALMCSDKIPTCATENEKCATAADCCDAKALCVNSFCSNPPPIK